MTTEIMERIKDVELKVGGHKSIEDGSCIMELVSYIAGEPWGDHPQCACPVLTSMAIRMNDRFSDEDRQKMKPLIPLLLNSRGTLDDGIARARFIAHRVATVTLPILADALGLSEIATTLRAFEPTQLGEIADYCRAKRDDFAKAARAADATAAYAYATAAAANAAADAAAAAANAAYAAADAAAAAANAAYANATAAYAANYANAANYADDAANYANAANAARLRLASRQIKESSIETLRLACGVWAEKKNI